MKKLSKDRSEKNRKLTNWPPLVRTQSRLCHFLFPPSCTLFNITESSAAILNTSIAAILDTKKLQFREHTSVLQCCTFQCLVQKFFTEPFREHSSVTFWCSLISKVQFWTPRNCHIESTPETIQRANDFCLVLYGIEQYYVVLHMLQFGLRLCRI